MEKNHEERRTSCYPLDPLSPVPFRDDNRILHRGPLGNNTTKRGPRRRALHRPNVDWHGLLWSSSVQHWTLHHQEAQPATRLTRRTRYS